MKKLTPAEKAELDSMLSEYVLLSSKYINEKDPNKKVGSVFKVLEMKNQIYSYIEKIKG